MHNGNWDYSLPFCLQVKQFCIWEERCDFCSLKIRRMSLFFLYVEKLLFWQSVNEKGTLVKCWKSEPWREIIFWRLFLKAALKDLVFHSLSLWVSVFTALPSGLACKRLPFFGRQCPQFEGSKVNSDTFHWRKSLPVVNFKFSSNTKELTPLKSRILLLSCSLCFCPAAGTTVGNSVEKILWWAQLE